MLSDDHLAARAFSHFQATATSLIRRWRVLRPRVACAPSIARCKESHSDEPFDIVGGVLRNTNEIGTGERSVFYLAYGSNLSAETFLGSRGIRPISQINVLVPDLKLTFDLPGIPYSEPCFANTSRRRKDETQPPSMINTLQAHGHNSSADEKTPLLSGSSNPPSYHKTRWHKPLVGVLYELTLADFATVIATEGGGAAYQDILVKCFPLASSPSPPTVPSHPRNEPIMGHTLFAPAPPPPDAPEDPPPSKPPSKGGGRYARLDPNYAQPSRRYLKLITDGAREHDLPREYQEYLAQIRPYRATTQGQRLGEFVYLTMWQSIVVFVFSLQALLKDDKGRSPEWLSRLAGVIFAAVWQSYDGYFSKVFGDGERTIGEAPDCQDASRSRAFGFAWRAAVPNEKMLEDKDPSVCYFV